MAATARNSLCQFWNDSNQNCEVPQVLQHATPASPPCASCSSLYAAAPPAACSSEGRRGTAGRTGRRASSRTASAPSRRAAPARARPGRPRASRGSSSCGAGSSIGLDSDEPFWNRIGGEHDVHAHLQELALPVLEGRLDEVAGPQVAAEGDRLAAVLGLLVVVDPHPVSDMPPMNDHEQRGGGGGVGGEGIDVR